MHICEHLLLRAGMSAFYTSSIVPEEESIETIQHAIDNGCNFLDTSDVSASRWLLGTLVQPTLPIPPAAPQIYGPFTNEELVGEVQPRLMMVVVGKGCW